jgi:hypothetical protein
MTSKDLSHLGLLEHLLAEIPRHRRVRTQDNCHRSFLSHKIDKLSDCVSSHVRHGLTIGDVGINKHTDTLA